MPTLAAETLRRFARRIIEAAGTPPEPARIVGDSLVDANLAGHDSHGVLRLVSYVGFARAGDVQPQATPSVSKRDRATAIVDGAWGWGQPAMLLATETALDLAFEFGLGAAVVNRCFHIGRVAPYVERIARAGMVGIAMSNAGPAVAPYGGRQRILGTNPVAWAVPRGAGQEPLSFDIATSGVAEGKLRVAVAKGEHVPPGLIVDTDGQISQNPDDFYAGGALLPFGGHKGYGFSVLAQILGRGLAGMGAADFDGPRGANGPLVLALDIRAFVPLDRFTAEIDAQCALITASPPAEGFQAVRVPGDPELAHRRQRLTDGIPIPDRTWSELVTVADELGVSVET